MTQPQKYEQLTSPFSSLMYVLLIPCNNEKQNNVKQQSICEHVGICLFAHCYTGMVVILLQILCSLLLTQQLCMHRGGGKNSDVILLHRIPANQMCNQELKNFTSDCVLARPVRGVRSPERDLFQRPELWCAMEKVKNVLELAGV